MNMNFFNFKGVSQNKMNEFNKNNNFNQKQNIMKKSILLLAVAASFAACTQNEEINDAISQQEIKFDQVLNKTTKAEIVNEAALASEGGFVVYGGIIELPADNSKLTFNGVNVYTDGNEGWTYATKRYWNKTATYNFYAIAPYLPKNGTYGFTNNGMFSITGAESAKATESDDFLIDRDGDVGISGAKPRTVSFDFHHIMAKVAFFVKKSEDITEDITIKSLTMTGWNAGLGNFTQTLTATPTTLEHSEWNFQTTEGGEASVISTDKLLTSATDSANCSTYIMVPQTIKYTAANGETDATGLTFNIVYTITYEDNFVETVNYKKVVDADQIWGTDSYTKYTLTIGATAIDFDVTSICGFCNEGNDQTLPVQP